MRPAKLLQQILLAVFAIGGGCAHADYYIVVNSSSSVTELTPKGVVDLYMGRARAFPNGDVALVFDLPRDDPKRAGFYTALTGMNPSQVNSYWSRLMFSGQSMPPQSMPDEATLIDIVKRNPSAIAWLSSEPSNPKLRTVLVIKELP